MRSGIRWNARRTTSPKCRLRDPPRGAATIRSDGSKAYSVQMSTSQGPCVVEEDVKNEGFDSDRPFETQLAWQNTPEKAWMQIALPHKAEASAAFFEEEVELRIKGMDPVRLPHPPVIGRTARTQWVRGRSTGLQFQKVPRAGAA